MILAIDPGVRLKCAWALLGQDGALDAHGFGRYGDCLALTGRKITDVVVEKPEYQGARTLYARDQDLIDLSWEGALLAGALAGQHNATLRVLTPTQWKGQVPKPAHHLRLWEKLTLAERMLVGGALTGQTITAAARKGALDRWKRSGASYYPKSFALHNVLDAVALGKFYVYGGNLGPRGLV